MYKLIDINTNTKTYKDCINTINDINNYKLKEDYKLISKYNNTVDLRNKSYKCPLYHYEKAFFNILLENNIIKELEQLTNSKVYLSHIQYRNAFKTYYSYQEWHRDTHYMKNKTFSGNIPPVYKVIFYPPINKIKECCLNIIPNSHLHFKNKGKNFEDYNLNELNMNYTDYKFKDVINVYPDNKLLIFNTSLYHNACMPVINDYQTRIIYSFTTDYDKILEYKNKTDFDIELIDKYLEYYKHIVI